MIFVTGATGLVGSYLCRYLMEKGEPVTALKRKTSKLDLLANVATKINWIEGDLLDVDLLLDATKNCKQIYHCAALVSYQKKMHQQLIDINVTGTKNIVNAALFNDAKKIVHVSSIAALGTNIKQKIINEKQNADKWNSAYGLSKHLAELEIFRGIAEGIDSVIINPSVILGAGYWSKNSGKLFTQADNNFRYYSSGSTGYVDVRDVVSIMHQLMHHNITNNRFIVSAQNLIFKVVLTDIAILLNKKPPSILAGSFLQNVALSADYFKSLFGKRERFLSRELIKTAYTTQQYDNAKIKAALPISFIPVEKSLREIASAYKQSKAENAPFGILPLVSNV